jgi:hypothetical protein
VKRLTLLLLPIVLCFGAGGAGANVCGSGVTDSECAAELDESLTDNGETPPMPLLPTTYNGVPIGITLLPRTS